MLYNSFSDTGTLTVYFLKPGPGLIKESYCIAKNIAVDYDDDGALISFDLFDAANLLGCQFLDTNKVVDGKPPFVLGYRYSEWTDSLTISFTLEDCVDYDTLATDDLAVNLRVSRHGAARVYGVVIERARSKICGFGKELL
jgi:uncharacterized protein YuzE